MTYIGLETDQFERSAPPSGNPLPAGLYTGIITRTQLKDTKAGDGNYLEVEFDISSPSEYSNRKFWDRFNIVNKSPEATRIGKEQLADLAKASGLKMLSEDTDLHGKEVVLILKVLPPKDNFQASNECNKYWPVGTTIAQHEEWRGNSRKSSGASPAPKAGWGKPSSAPVVQEESSSSTQATKPWARKPK